jgi:hypothetical protein
MTPGPAIFLALALLACACTDSTGDAGDLDGAVTFDGGSLGRCSMNDYLIIPTGDCPIMGCLGSSAFALCERASYSKCACAPPGAGWTLIDSGFLDAPDETRTDASHVDAR